MRTLSLLFAAALCATAVMARAETSAPAPGASASAAQPARPATPAPHRRPAQSQAAKSQAAQAQAAQAPPMATPAQAAPIPQPYAPSPYAPPAYGPAAVPLPQPVAVVAPPPAVVTVTAPFTDWRPLDAENSLVIDTSKGRIVIELRPEFAPLAVARVKRLARSRIYDGLEFHRVVEGFVAQTGDPNNLDGGKSQEPDLPAEFTFRLGAETPRTIVARPQGESEGFIGAQPYASVDEIRMATSPDRRVSAWGTYCAGVMGMGHDSDPDSGNSEIFFMRDTTRRLDRGYSVVGRVILGLDVIRALNAGDPPGVPDKMFRVRVLADLPDPERPRIFVLNTLSPQFWAIAQQVRAIRGADFSICDVEVPVRYDAFPAAADEDRPARKRRLRLPARRP